MSGARRWLHHRWAPYVTGVLIGLIVAVSTSVAWQRSYSQTAITLLGTGHGLSALISTESARVLIIGGDDPIAFANAFTDARPPTMRRIDLLVMTPGASPLVAQRAVELADPARIMAIQSRSEHTDETRFDDPIRMIGSPRTIDLAGELLIDIDPGLIDGQPDLGWSIRVQSNVAAVLLTESVPFRPAPNVALVAIMGPEITPVIQSLTLPVVIAADLNELPSGAFGRIAPGETRRIHIEPDSVTVPLDWVREPGA